MSGIGNKISGKSEMIVSVSAFLISIATFGVLIYQTQLWKEQNRLMLKQQYASVLPYLEIGYTIHNSRDFSLIVGNNGIGPAFIKDVSIQYKGQNFKGDPEEFLEKVIKAEGDTIPAFNFSRLTTGNVISAGKKVELLSIENDARAFNKLYNLFVKNNAELEITYESVYDESWKTKGIHNPPVKISK